MKKHLLFIIFAFGAVLSSAAQANGNSDTTVNFGITGGLINNNTDVNVSVLGFNVASLDAINKTGFYIGAFADIGLSEKFSIQPELTYGSAGDLGFVFLPVMMKYYVADNFNIHAGPQLNFSTNLNDIKRTIRDIEDVLGTSANIDDVLRTTGVDLAFGVGYDITDQFFAQARYALELTNRYSGPLGGLLDIKAKTLFIGLGYKFN